MEELIEILEDIKPDVDYEKCTTLIDEHFLGSLQIISLVVELEDAFDISIPTVEIKAENFNSAKALWTMVQKLKDED